MRTTLVTGVVWIAIAYAVNFAVNTVEATSMRRERAPVQLKKKEAQRLAAERGRLGDVVETLGRLLPSNIDLKISKQPDAAIIADETQIHQSGGHIDLFSELGHGSRFTIYLPAVEPYVDNILAKPFTGSQLIAKIGETLRQKATV